MLRGGRADKVFGVAGVIPLAEAASPSSCLRIHLAERARISGAECAEHGLPGDPWGRWLDLRKGSEERSRR